MSLRVHWFKKDLLTLEVLVEPGSKLTVSGLYSLTGRMAGNR